MVLSLAPTSDPERVRILALEAREYVQNWVRPGCGNGREEAVAAQRALRRSLDSYPALIPALIQDPDPHVRSAAILEVGSLERHGNESLIAKALASDSDPTIHAYAAGTLGRLGGPEAIRALRLALADADIEVRILSTAALLSLGQPVDAKVRTQVDAEAKARGMPGYVSRLNMFQR